MRTWVGAGLDPLEVPRGPWNPGAQVPWLIASAPDAGGAPAGGGGQVAGGERGRAHHRALPVSAGPPLGGKRAWGAMDRGQRSG